MLDTLLYMGVNAPKEHQEIITRLIYGLASLYMDGKTLLFPYPETMLDEAQTSPTPDILVYDKVQEQTKIIIEVSHSTGLQKDLEKIKEVMKTYRIEEGFVFNYRTGIWYKRLLADTRLMDNESFSTLLQKDLNDFLS